MKERRENPLFILLCIYKNAHKLQTACHQNRTLKMTTLYLIYP